MSDRAQARSGKLFGAPANIAMGPRAKPPAGSAPRPTGKEQSSRLVRQSVETIEDLMWRGGPCPCDYQRVTAALQAIHAAEFAIRNGASRRVWTSPELNRLLGENRDIFQTTATMQGFCRLKPHGYPGDYEAIERIYNKSISHLPALQAWDVFFHAQAGANAVRNRAVVAAAAVEEHLPRKVLSVACGSGLDLDLALRHATAVRRVTLLDSDVNAVARAKVNLQFEQIEIDPICKNALRFKPQDYFDMIWCAGLFDYLSDRAASYLLRRLKSMLSPKGVLLVGNFSHEHPSRAYMECIGEWLLVHRSGRELQGLAQEAGFAIKKITCINDPTGVNLFLVARAD